MFVLTLWSLNHVIYCQATNFSAPALFLTLPASALRLTTLPLPIKPFNSLFTVSWHFFFSPRHVWNGRRHAHAAPDQIQPDRLRLCGVSLSTNVFNLGFYTPCEWLWILKFWNLHLLRNKRYQLLPQNDSFFKFNIWHLDASQSIALRLTDDALVREKWTR